MSVAELENTIKKEREEATNFEPLPYYYIEIAKLLINHAKEDVIAPDHVASLVQDLENIRMDRLKAALLSMASTVADGESVQQAKVSNISAMEIYAVKGFIAESMSVFRRLTAIEDAPNRTVNQTVNNSSLKQSSNLRKFR